jgi:hypothetical protein
VIARLNLGGPALHVAYLTAGLQERGYETTLVAGSLARGEGSMAHVVERRGVEVLQLPELHREISPIRDLRAAFRLASLIRRVRPHILHTHTAKAGAVGRTAALLAVVLLAVGLLVDLGVRGADITAIEHLTNVAIGVLAARAERGAAPVPGTLAPGRPG